MTGMSAASWVRCIAVLAGLRARGAELVGELETIISVDGYHEGPGGCTTRRARTRLSCGVAVMDHVTSADGTRIAYRRLGSGPPVLAIHGGLGTWRSWERVATRLADRFEFFLVERRGRGDSGDSPIHSLAREVDDARAVLQRTGARAAIVGHSYGGAVALELARTVEEGTVTAVALYEPALGIGGLIPSAEIAAVEDLVADGELAAALDHGFAQLDAAGLVTTARLPPRSRRPAALVKLAPTIARELRAVDELGDDLDRYRRLMLPVLVLIGTNSPPPQRHACERLAATLANAQVAWLEGLGHVAHTAAPDAVAAALGPFLEPQAITGQPPARSGRTRPGSLC
jgi:pimeloyl-ACP methyl ester carboxylesterase